MSTIQSRLNRLTAAFPPPRCPSCGNAPSRLVFIDGRTNEVVSESVPESGCPDCGRQPYCEIHVVSEEGWKSPLSLI